MLTVTRKRIKQTINASDLRAIMNDDFEKALTIMPLFVQDGEGYATLEGGKRWVGQLTLREFAQTFEAFKNDLAVTPYERQMLGAAFKKGTKTAPEWIRVLDAARDWGIPPWELAKDNQEQFWFRRYCIVEGLKSKAT